MHALVLLGQLAHDIRSA